MFQIYSFVGLLKVQECASAQRLVSTSVFTLQNHGFVSPLALPLLGFSPETLVTFSSASGILGISVGTEIPGNGLVLV
ncbi:hypothetical protein HAX54_013108 [Datura stramonium]|uniref:Uncharacterized protein n=1 Tax=Datura stramonium TaxID=4076 RepID=A0ABS8RY25_DATST|nr:hypothetical protein [Datura stramonium]